MTGFLQPQNVTYEGHDRKVSIHGLQGHDRGIKCNGSDVFFSEVIFRVLPGLHFPSARCTSIINAAKVRYWISSQY